MANEGAPNVEGQPGAGGASAGDPNAQSKPATGSQQEPKGAPNPDPQQGKPKGTEDVDAKHRGLVADIQKERKARQELERRIAAYEAEIARERNRVKALAGLEPQSDEDREAEEIRQRLRQIEPGLAKLLDDETLKRLDKVIQMADTLERTTQHYWGRHGLNSLGAIEKKISDTFGELSPRQVKAIRAAYVTEAETNEEFARRHEEDPEALIEEFSKNWIEDWFESSKRRVTADEVQRQRRVPGARERNLVTPGSNKPVDVNDPKAVEDALVAGFRAKGGEFGRR